MLTLLEFFIRFLVTCCTIWISFSKVEEEKAATEVLIEEMSVQRAGAGEPSSPRTYKDAQTD